MGDKFKLPNKIFEGTATLNYCENHGWIFQHNGYLDVHDEVCCYECDSKVYQISVTEKKYDEIYALICPED